MLRRRDESLRWMKVTAPVSASSTLRKPRCFFARRRSERESAETNASSTSAQRRLSYASAVRRRHGRALGPQTGLRSMNGLQPAPSCLSSDVITHPFHPQRGGEIEVLVRREDRVFYRSPQGHRVSIPAAWMSLVPDDPFVVISDGRAKFRVDDPHGLTNGIRSHDPRFHARRDAVAPNFRVSLLVTRRLLPSCLGKQEGRTSVVRILKRQPRFHPGVASKAVR